MSAKTGALSTTPRPLGKPGGPGLFHDKSLHLPPYVQNVAHSLMRKRGMSKSRAIATALAAMKRWAAGGEDVKPEVRAAAIKALAEWEAARAKALATPNKGEKRLSQPMQVVRAVLDGPQAVDLAQPAKDAEDQQKTKRKGPKRPELLPPGAVGYRHGWQPVDANGNPVGRPLKPGQVFGDMKKVSTEASREAIRQAYRNKAKADAEKAAKKAKTARKAAQRKEEAKKKRAAAEAKRRQAAKERAAKKAATDKKRKAQQAAREKERRQREMQREKQRLISQATRQALADKKAGRTLTPTQERLLEAYEREQAKTLHKLRNEVTLSQPMQVVLSVLEHPDVIDLAPPGSRGYIYTHGWKLKPGINLPNNGRLPKGGHKVVGKKFAVPGLDEVRASVAPVKKQPKQTPEMDPAMRAVFRMKADEHEAKAKQAAASSGQIQADADKIAKTPQDTAAKYTAAKKAKTQAYQAISEANKVNTPAAHEKAAKALLDAYKASTAAGLKNSAKASLEGAQAHMQKVKALGGAPKTSGAVSDAAFSVLEEIQIESAAAKLADMPEAQFAKLAKQHGNGKKATTRTDQLRAEAIKRAGQLRGIQLSNALEFGAAPVFGGDTVSTVSSQDGARATVNSLLAKAPRRKVTVAAKQARKKRRNRRKGGK